MKKKVLVPLAHGFEEIEAVTVIDILRRAGVEVTVAGLDKKSVKGSRGVTIVPDTDMDSVADEVFDAVILPGGLDGTMNLAQDKRVIKILRNQAQSGRINAAICAAPIVLQEAGVLEGKDATSHPAVRDRLKGFSYREDRVVASGSLITSRGPGTAMEFAFTLVTKLVGEAAAREVNEGVMARL